CEAIPKGEHHLHTPKSFVYAVDEDMDVGLEDMPSDLLAEFVSSISLGDEWGGWGEEDEKSSFRCVRAATAAVSSMLSSPSSTHGRTSRPAPTTTVTETTIESSLLVARVQCDANVLPLLREVPDLVEPTKIVEAVRKKKTSLENDGVDDSSTEITTYYSKHHNGAGHVQRSGGALAATHSQSVVLAQLEAQFRGEVADEGDQVGGGPPSGTSTAPALTWLLW
ncbi:hypothetical protein PI125_g26242, partial [Phytophthora idaei]